MTRRFRLMGNQPEAEHGDDLLVGRVKWLFFNFAEKACSHVQSRQKKGRA